MAGALPAGAVQALARRAGALCPAGAASQPGAVARGLASIPRDGHGSPGLAWVRGGAQVSAVWSCPWTVTRGGVTEVVCPPAGVRHVCECTRRNASLPAEGCCAHVFVLTHARIPLS